MPHSVHVSPAPKPLPYWQVNVPPSKRTEHCPDYLLGQSEKNIRILSTRDEDYHRNTWDEVQTIVATNRIDLFQRVPTDLRRYLKYIYDLKRTYGSVLSFVQHERLHWASITPSEDPPFTNPSDHKILWNDWPYGIDTNISHICVWTKFLLEDDPTTDDLTPRAKAEIDRFVVGTFCAEGGVPRDNVIWFKNWRSVGTPTTQSCPEC